MGEVGRWIIPKSPVARILCAVKVESEILERELTHTDGLTTAHLAQAISALGKHHATLCYCLMLVLAPERAHVDVSLDEMWRGLETTKGADKLLFQPVRVPVSHQRPLNFLDRRIASSQLLKAHDNRQQFPDQDPPLAVQACGRQP
jgi:hypothetical protein